MSKIYNSQLQKEIVEATKLQISMDKTPNEASDKVVFTCEVNPKLLKSVKPYTFTSSTTAGTTTLLPANTSQDFYITGVAMSMVASVLCDLSTANYSVNAVIDGSSRALISYGAITLTAQEKNIYREFNRPIKIDRGTTITFTTTAFTAGVCLRLYAVYGYYDESSNA
jgi:hypothetical protein